jgi:hypothetical protein
LHEGRFYAENASPGRRAASYWFIDGLPEIVLGVSLLLLAAVGLLWRAYTSPGSWGRFYFLVVAAGFGVLLWKGNAVVDLLKSRVTYPRTGYVPPPEDAEPRAALTMLSIRPGPLPNENTTSFRRRSLMLVWGCIYAGSVGNLTAQGQRWLGAASVVFLAVAVYWAGRRSERPYRWWSLLALALTALVFLWVDLSTMVRRLLPLFLVGGWFLAQGVCTLVQYLRENPYPRASEGVGA